MMKKWTKRILSGLLCAAMLLPGTLAAGGDEIALTQQPAPWSHAYLADSYAMGLMDDNYGTYIEGAVNAEQLALMTAIVADKLALLQVPTRPAGTEAALVIDNTRGGVMNALYQEAAAYQFEGIEAGTTAFLTGLGVVQGTGGDLAQARICTYQEAMVMASRLILALYDSQDAGSKGLLWKAVSGDNTLYLLGTIHMDRSNVYPLHKSLRDAVDASQTVVFELDFNDTEGMNELIALQTYAEGDSLKAHISPELYNRVVAALLPLGMTEVQIESLKPWALANSFNVLGLQDDTTGTNAMAIDLYLNSRASNVGKTIAAVETYAFQGELFDTLSQEYQQAYLNAALTVYETGLAGAEPTDEELAIAQASQQAVAAMFESWKNRDPKAFEEVYQKAAVMNSGDELNVKLFAGRDPGMIAAAADYLETEGENTFFLAVGAGHMVDPGGIVTGLRELGYTVELVK